MQTIEISLPIEALLDLKLKHLKAIAESKGLCPKDGRSKQSYIDVIIGISPSLDPLEAAKRKRKSEYARAYRERRKEAERLEQHQQKNNQSKTNKNIEIDWEEREPINSRKYFRKVKYIEDVLDQFPDHWYDTLSVNEAKWLDDVRPIEFEWFLKYDKNGRKLDLSHEWGWNGTPDNPFPHKEQDPTFRMRGSRKATYNHFSAQAGDPPAVVDAKKLLGIMAGDTFSDIKRKYRTLARENHSDLGGTHDAMVRVNNAFEILEKYYHSSRVA